MKKMSPLKVVLIAGVTLSLQTSCTTMFGAKKKAHVPHSEVVLQKSGLGVNQVKGKDKQYWVEFGKKSKKNSDKMVASLASGDSASSESHARQVLRKNPGNIKALSILSASLAQNKNFALAGFYAKEILRRDENNALALNIVGLSHLMTANAVMKDFRMAMQFFEKAGQSNSNEIAALLNLSYLQLDLGMSESAYNTFAAAHERCDGCFYASIGRGMAATRVGKYDVAKSDFERILDENPESGEAMYRLALLMKNGYNDQNEAKDILNKLQTESNADENLKRRAYVLARKLEDSRDSSKIAEENIEGNQAEGDDLDVLYKALETK